MKTHRAMPVLQVRDVRASAAFYETVGFHCHGFIGEPADFAVIQRGDVTLALDRSREAAIPVNQWWAAYLYVSDANALHAELAALKINGLTKPQDQPWGCRDFEIVDPDGHRIAFGQDLTDNPHGPGRGPERGRG